MDILEKARILGNAGQYDSCGPKQCEVRVKNSLGGLYHAKSENKNCVMLKTLMSNACSFDCKYCSNSTHCEKKNIVSYTPNELNLVFNKIRKEHKANGLFLSSGIRGNPDKATEQMIEALKLVRKNFNGYIHFKVLPGTSYHLIKQASELSNRMSINIEAPNKSIINELSTTKEFKTDILRRQAWIKNLNMSQSTQMIVNELMTDKEIVNMVNWQYNEMKLKRVYYSAFKPVKGTPFENKLPESMKRENRLYNVDALFRLYNYNKKEILSVMDNGMLPNIDPKLAIARNLFKDKIEINDASFDELIKIPGIGLNSAEKIIFFRENNKFKSFNDFNRKLNLGSYIERAKPFLTINGERQKVLMDY
jgi:predicted DNA-binding helix-hairpin-helix protein